MILLDTDVLILDLFYPNDPRFNENREVLSRLRGERLPAGIMVHALLELVGKLSFNTATNRIPGLFVDIPNQYQLVVLPDPDIRPEYTDRTITDVLAQMSTKMALGDTILALQIQNFAPAGSILLTWNAKHFRGKVAVPVLTPQEWLTQHPPAGPTP